MEPAADRDLPEVRRLLAAAQGYAVFGRDRKRVGILIEVAADSNGGKIAVRRDGVFVWRRELLSLATVARVDDEEHTVLLNVESDALHDDPEPIAATPEPAPDRESDWRGRISRYVETANGEPDGSRSPDRHLQFISTFSGYRLVEMDGPPPSSGETVEVAEEPEPFRVIKLGPSPLPNDDRVCAYLLPP
jgi:hypothetical protein